MSMSSFSHLLPPTYKKDIQRWIDDDCPNIDIGGYVVGEKIEVAHLLCKSSGVLAGVPFAQAVFDHFDLEVAWNYDEGTYLDCNQPNKSKIITAVVKGKCRNILLAERTALNTLSRASGVATLSKQSVDIAKANTWHGWIAGTRKTTPGFKFVEKYALLVGGAATHRQDLSQMVMLKDNHIWSAGSITQAVNQAKLISGFSCKIEVECQSVLEGLEAASAGADIVMLDNFTSSTIHDAAKEIKAAYPHVLIEASGGITPETLHLFMSPYIDIISQGALTQGYPCIDFSLKIQPALQS